MKKLNKRDSARWLKKAKRVFNIHLPQDGGEQWDRAVDLARDIWRTLDPKGWKNEKT